jgi:hypothetical protein
MNHGSTLFLKLVITGMALVALALCIFAFSTGIMTDNTGLYRPILLGMYLPAIPFFVALLQGWKLLNYIDANTAFSQLSVRALQKIKFAAGTITGIFLLGMPYIYYAAEIDDAPGVILVGLVIIGAAGAVATFAAVLQKLIQRGLDLQSENDLTV